MSKHTLTPTELQSLEMRSSLKLHTQVMFKAVTGANFKVAPHHLKIFKKLEEVVDGKCPRLIINMPPRFGKTETCVKSFISWGFALNAMCKFLHISYSDTLAYSNSEKVREYMSHPMYKRLFPNSSLKDEKQSVKNWDTLAGGQLYARPSQGQITGFGAGSMNDFIEEEITPQVLRESGAVLDGLDASYEGTKNGKYIFSGAVIIDDPIKPEDALSDIIRDRINQRFITTVFNRVNSRHTPIIIIMQRVHENDLTGFLLEAEAHNWDVLSIPAIEENEQGDRYSIWSDKHTLAELDDMRMLNELNFDTQYMQNPTPAVGLMYSAFKEYDEIPATKRAVPRNYTDTADTGADSLCSINYIDTEEGCFVTDVLFTKKPMEFTEPATARHLSAGGIKKARIEANNGGRGFARSVERNMRARGNNITKIEVFTQTKNKKVRINSNSAKVTNLVYMPKGWKYKFPDFYKQLTGYRKEAIRQRDDAADAITGVVESHELEFRRAGIKRRN